MKNTGKIAFFYIEKFVFYLTKKNVFGPKRIYIHTRYWRIVGLYGDRRI